MISAWHLLWIVPLAMMAGFGCIACMVAAGRGEREYDNLPPSNDKE